MTNSFSIHHLPGRTIQHDGNPYLFFSGTAYLGLPQHPAFQQLVIESIRRYGTTFGSSRNGNLRLAVYEEAEAKLAASAGAGAALTLSSGMMAGQTVINWLRAQKALFIYGPNTHPALWDSPTRVLPALSFADWAAQLPEQLRWSDARDHTPGPIAVLVNSLEAVRSEFYEFSWMDQLPADRPILLIVDDSHGLGVLNVGAQGYGRGIWPQLPGKRRDHVRLIVTASLAKAMGLPGGVVFSDAHIVAELRQTAFFGACSPMPPAYLDAYINAEPLYVEGYNRLQRNLKQAETLLLPTGLFQHAPGYPVFFTEQDDLYAYLLRRGVFIYSFAYPTAADRANTRIVISAFHEPADVQQLAERVYEYCDRIKTNSPYI
ncbi:pyridoxal phosphate-dependent aminotransferase family protein [Spirosoma taeanense]|uniref:Pyridoxal phosphate-dependent aminotransferase family protein n=1 Tax=Spirosoma taeanense TaxID=2735870 RepID=A0A6M5Y3W9_9BACT|nr:aminotransferase class I/II-fold pyridoxal phosphate-dependent enzyme [Spirosoma taeanense]QJW88509.1 pyridoxal phosphate-dependent aminotransferase family protein [Spirosoma taeanense]